MLSHQGTVEHSNADGDCCINSVLVNVLTKGQGRAILPMEGTKLQELRKIENGTNRELIRCFSERVNGLRSQMAKKRGNDVTNCHL